MQSIRMTSLLIQWQHLHTILQQKHSLQEHQVELQRIKQQENQIDFSYHHRISITQTVEY